MAGSESDSIANICCKKIIDYARLSFTYFSKDTKSLLPSAPAKISQFFHIMKIFEQTVESELEDSSGEYETEAERISRNRRADAVRESFVTSIFNF